MVQLEEKCQNMQLTVDRFMVKFDVLRQKGLPNPLVANDRLMKHEDYDHLSLCHGLPLHLVLMMDHTCWFETHRPKKYLM